MNTPAVGTDWDALLQARAAAPRRPLVMHQRWEKLLFLHWTLNAEELQPTLPAGLTVDTCQGEAFIGVSPFFMRNVRPPRLPALPWFSNFQELNVRTYVKDRFGVPGIWFYSLDCNQPFAVIGARLWLGLPYYCAEMSTSQSGGIDYRSRRKGTSEAARYLYRVIGPARETQSGTLEFFLLERYFLYTRRSESGPLLRVQVKHVPYTFCEVHLEKWSSAPLRQDRLIAAETAPVHQCFVDGFDVRVHGVEKVM